MHFRLLRLRSTADERGFIAIIFAVLLMVIAMVAAGAVDFAIAFSARSKAQNAADSAALAGARAASDYLVAHGATKTDLAKAEAEKAARNHIAANFVSAELEAAPTIVVNTSTTGTAATSEVTVSGAMKTYLLPVVGIDQLPFRATSTATLAAETGDYYQFVFLVDVSNSMTVGGTQGDIGKLTGDSDIRCAFACHDTSNQSANFESCGGDKQPSCNKRELARTSKNKIKLKIDYVNDAVQEFLAEIKALDDASASRNHFSVAVHTFGTSQKTLVGSTTDIPAAITAARSLDAEAAITYDALGYSYIADGLTYLKSKISDVGDGSSASKRKTYVVILTDGIQNVPGGQYWGHSTNLDYVSECNALKTLNLSIFTVYATYYQVPASDSMFGQYISMVDGLRTNVPATLRNCASEPSQYFEASDGVAVGAALDAIADAVKPPSNLRLMN